MNRKSAQKSAEAISDEEVRFSPRPCKGLAGVIIGSLITVAGILLIAFPISAVFIHPGGGEDMPGPVYLERVTPESSRVYGVLGLLFGSCLIWLARWPRWGKRNAAIEDYVWGLSQELARRFGWKNWYTIEEVSKTAQIGGYRIGQIAHAHAIFCSRSEFEAEYESKWKNFTYDGLRDVVVRRYFGGAREFDAASVVRLARPPRDEEWDLAELSG